MTHTSPVRKPVNDLSKQSDEFIQSIFDSFIAPKIQISK
nr:MAG TPA: hypothetical protein [Caudoviricetes sp.]